MAKLIEDLNNAVVAAAPGKTVIRIGYMGDRAKNRGLDQAIATLRLKYPGAEIVAVEIKPSAKADDKPLEGFHAQLGQVQR